MGLVVAYHLSKDFKNAIKMLDSFYETVAEEPLDTESSEGFLYRNMIIEESGDYQKALKDLDMIENKVVDRIGWQESKGLNLAKRELIKTISENSSSTWKIRGCTYYIQSFILS